jgi:hypothetical protein
MFEWTVPLSKYSFMHRLHECQSLFYLISSVKWDFCQCLFNKEFGTWLLDMSGKFHILNGTYCRKWFTESIWWNIRSWFSLIITHVLAQYIRIFSSGGNEKSKHFFLFRDKMMQIAVDQLRWADMSYLVSG